MHQIPNDVRPPGAPPLLPYHRNLELTLKNTYEYIRIQATDEQEQGLVPHTLRCLGAERYAARFKESRRQNSLTLLFYPLRRSNFKV